MSIKQFNNPTSGFRNLFNRAQKFDSTGTGVRKAAVDPMAASGGVTAQYSTPTGSVYQSHTFNNCRVPHVKHLRYIFSKLILCNFMR